MLKLYHFHRTQHEAIYADSEEQARADLQDRHPFEYDLFTLEDVQDVPGALPQGDGDPTGA
jgi:hypothetical protein